MSWFSEWLRGDAPVGAGRPADGGTARDGDRADDRTGDRDAARGTGRAAPGREAPSSEPEQAYPGEHFGLPEHGRDSVATLGVRGGQFVLDLVLGGLIANLVHAGGGPLPWWLATAVWLVLVLPSVAFIGQTPAMVVLGMRVARVDAAPRVGLLWATVRTLSLVFVLPALFLDRDARGAHDRVSRTIVLRTR